MGSRFLPLLLLLLAQAPAMAACCYFSAKDKDVNQPGQKAFITWDPQAHREAFTVQPKFEGDARDFGMVIPTPTQPKLDEMPRDFFKQLAVFTILLPFPQQIRSPFDIELETRKMKSMAGGGPVPCAALPADPDAQMGVRVLEAGVVGSLDYKIITAENSQGLYEWLKQNQYSYSGDEKTLGYYIDKKWIFTVMKIDTQQMKKNPDGSYLGEVTPTRFAFRSESLVYPLRITAISVKKNTEALFYVQSPQQMDLKGNWSWLWSYRIMWLTSGTVCISQKQMTEAEQKEYQDRQEHLNRIHQELPDFDTTKLEWSHRLTDAILTTLDKPENYAQGGFPDLPDGAWAVSIADLKTAFWERHKKESPQAKDEEKKSLDYLDSSYSPDKGQIVRAPGTATPTFYWFANREAPPADVKDLAKLKGHLTKGMFLTKFRKRFLKHEMNDDLDLVPVLKAWETEYIRILPQSPP